MQALHRLRIRSISFRNTAVSNRLCAAVRDASASIEHYCQISRTFGTDLLP